MLLVMYQGSEFIGHKFKNHFIHKEYGINAKLISSGNPTSNAISERIHWILGNLVRTNSIQESYVNKDGPWLGILSVAVFVIHFTQNILKGYTTGQLIFVHDTILPMNFKYNWELIHQRKQMNINDYNDRKK